MNSEHPLWKELYTIAQETQYRARYGFSISTPADDTLLWSITFCTTTPEEIQSLRAAGNPCISRVHAFITKARLLGVKVEGWP